MLWARGPRWRRRTAATLGALAAGAVVAVGLATASPTPNEPSRAALSSTRTDCRLVILYYSRGSGQALDQTERGGDVQGLAQPGIALFKALSEAYGSEAVGTFANAYPAVNVSPRVKRVYLPSAKLGARSLERNVRDLIAACPSSKLVLGGYSQGAQAIHAALAHLSEDEAKQIGAVVLFGDPYFSARDPEVAPQRSTSAGLAFNPRRVGVALYRALRFPPLGNLPPPLEGKVFSWCHRFDPVCQGVEFLHLLREAKNKAKSHFDYNLDREAAASKIVASLKQMGIYPKASLNDRHRIANTCAGATCGVALWSKPRHRGARARGALANGERVSIVCQVLGGERVSAPGTGSSRVWDKLNGGAYVPDLFVDTPGLGVASPEIRTC